MADSKWCQQMMWCPAGSVPPAYRATVTINCTLPPSSDSYAEIVKSENGNIGIVPKGEVAALRELGLIP